MVAIMEKTATAPGAMASRLTPGLTPGRASRAKPVDFLGADAAARLIGAVGAGPAIAAIACRIEAAFRRWAEFDKSARLPAYSPTGVIELMPVADGQTWGFKYVNGHPGNARQGLPTVVAFGALAGMADGRPTFLADLTLATALRTAAMSALAASRLARSDSATMALIGNGAQSEFQAIAFRHLLGIRRLRVHDIDPTATAKLCRNLAAVDVGITVCASAVEACAGADIVTTATAAHGHVAVVDAAMVGAGVHLNAIGGDSPGKTELAADLVAAADVFVEFEPQARVEGEIQQLPAAAPVTELWRVFSGLHPGRSPGAAGRAAITLFDSVGFALEDFVTLQYLQDAATSRGMMTAIDLVPEPVDPRDLYGAMIRAHHGESGAA